MPFIQTQHTSMSPLVLMPSGPGVPVLTDSPPWLCLQPLSEAPRFTAETPTPVVSVAAAVSEGKA
ncbi:hypothetical protein EYF80_009206 [Liparis tanakae]|uniref:Uncharacterized protein n=1 Tax=Liparis tanakae TaxID=230148 RepID=A0A4Z2IRS4_9TELE|nr:hypothetical protein EYF80_009206 [Liparis tanakae]